MGEENILHQFSMLEERVESLIKAMETLTVQNVELQSQVSSLKEELQGKADLENRLTQERAVVRSRIDNLLARMDEISREENRESD